MQSQGFSSLTDVIIVPGHAVVRLDRLHDIERDDAWVLQPYQAGEARLYIEHVRAGVEQAHGAASSLLVFSGGATRVEAGPISEAQSYLAVAQRFAWWGRPDVASRTVTERYARDSFENLLFGICRFRECRGHLPRRVTVVGWAFKRRRFEMHREAIGFPRERFTYMGVGDPPDREAALHGELRLAIEPFSRDPFGVRSPLADKRNARNPFGARHDYAQTCPELRELLSSDRPLPPDRNPW